MNRVVVKVVKIIIIMLYFFVLFLSDVLLVISICVVVEEEIFLIDVKVVVVVFVGVFFWIEELLIWVFFIDGIKNGMMLVIKGSKENVKLCLDIFKILYLLLNFDWRI